LVHINARHTGGAIFIRLGQRKGDKPGTIKGIRIHDVTVDIPKGKPDVGYDIAGPPEEDIYPHNLLPIEIVGLPGHDIHDVTLENINVTFGGGADKAHAYVSLDSLAKIPERVPDYPEFSMFGELPAWGIYARHADGLNINGLNIPTAAQLPVMVLRKVNGEVIKNLKTPFSAKKAILKQ
jgi:hypothetical protein